MYHAALHPPNSSPSSLALDAVAVTAPMLLISPQTRPATWIEVIGRILSCFAGRLGLIRAIRGNLSDDPMYVSTIYADSGSSFTHAKTTSPTTVLFEWIQVWQFYPALNISTRSLKISSAPLPFTTAPTTALRTRKVLASFLIAFTFATKHSAFGLAGNMVCRATNSSDDQRIPGVVRKRPC